MRSILMALVPMCLLGCGGVPLDETMSQQGKLSADGYRLTDNGVRCMRAPCPAIRVTPLNGGPAFDVTDVVAEPSLSESDKELVGRLPSLPQGLQARGTLRREGEQHIFTVQEVLSR